MKKLIEKSRECHNHKPQPTPTPRGRQKQRVQNKQTNAREAHRPALSLFPPSRHDWKIVDWDVKPQHNQISLFPKRDGHNVERTEKQHENKEQGKTETPYSKNHKAP